MVVHVYNPSTSEEGGSGVLSWPGLASETPLKTTATTTTQIEQNKQNKK
jgi:hypothetical protein